MFRCVKKSLNSLDSSGPRRPEYELGDEVAHVMSRKHQPRQWPKMARANTYIHYSPGMQEELFNFDEVGPHMLLPDLPEVK